MNSVAKNTETSQTVAERKDRHVVARIPAADTMPVPIILGEPDYRLFLCCRGPETGKNEQNEQN
ncbi:MAG TPA: hypothetical protein VGB22_06925 [candidate division Zixibacteria bacterium]|jgi:hypothetical protein